MSTLPHIDEHAVPTTAPRFAVWGALIEMLRTTMGPHRGFVTLLAADPTRLSEPFTGAVGDTLPGFRVVDSVRDERLVLEGRHRFARYRVTFVIDDHQIRAITDAEFPGTRGRMYRAFILGSTAHARITRRMIERVASAAARR